MKNIAIITPSLSGGGAERIAGLLSVYLSKIYKVYIFIRYKDRVTYRYGGELIALNEAADGKEVITEYALLNLKKKYFIDVAISFMDGNNFANIMSCCGEKVVISERSMYGMKSPRLEMTDRSIRKLYPCADEIVACSYGVSTSLTDDYGISPDQINVIYNFIDKEQIEAMSLQSMSDDVVSFIAGSNYFINVGRLFPVKRQELLIRQFKLFHDHYGSDIKLVILGDGPLLDDLNELIKELDLSDIVRIFRYTTNPFPYIRNSVALISTSEYEGLPNVILEAMSLSVPVIATDYISGPRELLNNDTDYKKKYEYPSICDRGIIVSHEMTPDISADDSDLCNAMRMMLDGKKRVLFQNIELEYMNQYSNEKILKQWVDIIEEDVSKDDRERQARNAEIVSEYHAHSDEMLRNAENIYIYGTGVYGKRVYNTFSSQYKIKCFLRTNPAEGEEIFGISVKRPDEVGLSDADCVILGVSELYADEVYESILCNGCDKILEVF